MQDILDWTLQRGVASLQTAAEGWSGKLSKTILFLENQYFIIQLGLKLNTFRYDASQRDRERESEIL